jgi:hypothetical protein
MALWFQPRQTGDIRIIPKGCDTTGRVSDSLCHPSFALGKDPD